MIRLKTIELVTHEGTRYNAIKRRAKVGELVKVVANTHIDKHSVAIGTIGKIVEKSVSTERLRIDDGNRWARWLADDDYVVLEPLKIAIGDKVRVLTKTSLVKNEIDTSVPHVVKDISDDGETLGVRNEKTREYRSVRTEDVQPWKDASFSVGDTVKIVRKVGCVSHAFSVGDVGTVTVVRGDDRLFIRVGTLNQWVVPIDVEKVVDTPGKPQKGDWVRSTTGRSQTEYSVPTNESAKVVAVGRNWVNVRMGGDGDLFTLMDGTYKVVEAPKLPKAKVGDWVRSTTGIGWMGAEYPVPTDKAFKVSCVYSDGVHIDGCDTCGVLSDGTYEIVDAPKTTPNVKVGDYVQSTTGRSQIGFTVPTNKAFKVTRVFDSGAVNVDSGKSWSTLDAGTFKVVDAPTPGPIEAFNATNAKLLKSFHARTPNAFKTGDIVELTKGHPYAGQVKTLGAPWTIRKGFTFTPPTTSGIGLATDFSTPNATLVTPVELRTDISIDEKLRLLGLND